MRFRQIVPVLLAPLLASLIGIGCAAALISLALTHHPDSKSLLQAAEEDQVDLAVRFIMRGQRADAPAMLESDLLHWRKGDVITPFLIAVARGHDNLVRVMLRSGVRLSAEPNDQALCVAARYGHASEVRLLMANGAPYTRCEGANGKGWGPGEVASKRGYRSLAKMLESYGMQREAESLSANAIRCDHATTVACLD